MLKRLSGLGTRAAWRASNWASMCSAAMIVAIVAAGASGQLALPPGSTVTPPNASIPQLSVRDALIPFTITSAGGAVLYRANFEDEVGRVASGDLIFGCRIRDVSPGLNGIISRIDRFSYSGYTTSVYYDATSLGTVPPSLATRSSGSGSDVAWRYSPGIPSSSESKFAGIVTNAHSFNLLGTTVITLTTGESVTLTTAQPGAGTPRVIITAPSPFGCVCSPATITGTADASDGFASYTVEYATGPGGPWTTILTSSTPVTNGTLAMWNTSGLAGGYYFLRVRVSNIDGTEVSETTVVLVDSAFDSLDLRAPIGGALYGGVVCFDGTANDSCFGNYTLGWRPSGGGSFTTFVTSLNPVINDPLGSLNAGGFADGMYDVLLKGTDACGHMASIVRTIKIDNTPPVARITDPVNCDTVRGIVRVIGTAFDANISGWSLAVTGGPYNDFVTIATGSTNIINNILALWDTNNLPPCCYTLRLRVDDRATVNCSGVHQTDFYTSLDIGSPDCGADFNHDGGIDGADVGAFFAVWENGGCLP